MKDIRAIYSYERMMLTGKDLIIPGLQDQKGEKNQEEIEEDEEAQEEAVEDTKVKNDVNDPKSKKAEKAFKEKQAKVVIRYIISDILGWTVSEAESYLNADIFYSLKMDVLAKYLYNLPKDLDMSEDFDYFVDFCFDKPYDYKRKLVRLFDQLWNGEISKYPRNFFKNKGKEKLSFLLMEFISKNMANMTIEELYKRFSEAGTMNAMLNASNVLLKKPMDEIYGQVGTGSPLDFLHNCLPEDQRDDFLYSFYQFQMISRKLRK